MKRYSLTPRIGTLMMRFLSLPMIDSSAMMSAMLLRIASRTFWRWRRRSPALRSLRWPEEELYGRKMVCTARSRSAERRCRAARQLASILPEVVGGVLEHHVHAARAVAVVEQGLDHGVVFFRLLLVAHARFGNDPAQIAHRGDELFLDRFLQRLVTAVVDLFAAPVGCPEIGDHLLAKAVGRRADDRDLLLDGLHKALVGRQLFLGVAVLDLALVDVGLGVIEVVLEQRLGLLLIGIDERPGDFLLEDLQILLVQRVLEEFQIL